MAYNIRKMDGIEEVKARVNIEDVVSDYVQLKRAGRNWKGLSPFTSEKTPSFIVSPEKQIWHDFSSNKGGDVFSFVMEMEGLDFKGALELLARKAGVDLSQYRQTGGQGGLHKERLYDLLELSTKFYQLHFSKHPGSLAYVLEKRQFTKETASQWRLGYAPNTGTALISFLRSRGYTEGEMRQAGVCSQRSRGLGDMFRGRLMIPLCDAQGRVIGFTARILIEDINAPKYINTPQTVLYDKSRHVFGLHLAKESIRKTKFAVVAEGNLDVIASHQAAVQQVVAIAGTALTEYHLKIISRFTGDIRVCFDADRAGLAATERAIPIAAKVGVSLSVIDVPNGKDPDELIRHDPALWQRTVHTHRYALDWLMDRYAHLLDLTTAVGKKQYSDVLLPIVHRLTDPVEQDHFLTAIAETLGASRSAITAKLALTPASQKKVLKHPVALKPLEKTSVEESKVQDHFLALMLLRPALRTHLAYVTEDMLIREDSKQLVEFLRSHHDFSGKPSEIVPLQPIAEYVKILKLQYEELYQDLDSTELQYEATRLTARLVETYVKRKKQVLVAKFADADDAYTSVLLEQVTHLDALLKQSKGGV